MDRPQPFPPLSSFTTEELRCLRTFYAVCTEILACRFVRNLPQQEHRLTIERREDGRTRTQSPSYDRDDLRSFLTLLRKLLAPKEPSYIYRIINIFAKHDPKECTAEYRQFRKALNDMERSYAGVRISIGTDKDEKEFTPKRMLDTVFNADVFHSDASKQDDLRRLRDFSPVTRPFLVKYCIDVVNIALPFAAAIRNRGYL